MKRPFETSALDDALLEFEIACPFPSVDDAKVWQAKYPAFADEILDSAANTAELVLSGAYFRKPRPDPRDEEVMSLLLDVVMTEMGRGRPVATLASLAEHGGRSLAEIEAAMGMSGGVIQSAASGELAGSVPGTIVERFRSVVGVSPEVALAAFEGSYKVGEGAHLSASAAPLRPVRTYAQAIAATEMSEEQKAFWLRDG